METLLQPWLLWFVAGVGLAFLEMAVPGFVILFFGIGCIVTAAVAGLFDITVTQQVLTFGVSTILSLALLRRLFVRYLRGQESESRDGYDDSPMGAHVKVVQTVSPAMRGKVLHRGTSWTAASNERIEEGELAEITGYADNSRLVFTIRKIQQ